MHTYSKDPDNPNDQRNTTAMNAFAVWATANGGSPRVFGLGAMQAYVRLPGGVSSEFYLAQIDKEHAGKTMVISLWDPGDTGNLAANLQILKPTTSSYQPATFSYGAHRDPAPVHLFRSASLLGHGHERGRLVEDPLQHERQHIESLHGHDDVGSGASG